MKEKTVKLLEPVIVGGEERAEVTIRRSTVGDEEDAMDMAIRLKRPKNNVTVEVCMFSKLTKLPYDAIRSMCGQDYTALANYLHGHWCKEFGGHRYKASRSCVRPEPEPATEAVRDYSPTRPPVAPRGYILVESRATQYGFLYFKYVWDPKNETHKRTGSRLL